MKKNAKCERFIFRIRNWAELEIGKSHCAQIRALILSASLICTPRLLTQD